MGAHAASPEPIVYWKSILQNNPMPKIIKDLLYTTVNDIHKDSSTSSKDQVKDQHSNVFLYGAANDIHKDSSSPSKDQVKNQPANVFLYGAANEIDKDFSSPSKDQVKDQPSNVFLYGTANDIHKDSSSPSKDQVKDQPSNIFLYGAANDIHKDYSSPSEYQVNDQSSNIFLYGAANDNHKDSSSTSKDQFKDQPSNIFLYGAADDIHRDSSSPAKDQPSNIFVYGSPNDIHKDSSSSSKDEVKDPSSNVFLYGAANDIHKDSSPSKDQVKDQPSNVFLYGAANDNHKDSSLASKDEVKDQPSNVFLYGASNVQVKDHPQKFHQDDSSMHHFKNDPIVKLLFLENNLLQGVEMELHFTKNDQKTPFLPRKISDSMPFSSEKLPEIYDTFSVKPNSMEAEIMKQTLKLCENKGIDGEEIFCATSLESMIDFSTTKLGKKVKVISSVVNAKESTPSQMYKIEEIKKLAANKVVVCHIQNYMYAVFYCHISVGTQSYVVSLDGADGTKVKSVAVCHTNTSKWNPKHVAFQLLKVTPGTIPICHFLPEDHVLWVPY